MLYHRTVLLIDRQHFGLHSLREIMRQSGMTVMGEARNTDDGMAKFERFLPDVVVMDISTPGTDNAVLLIKQMIKLHPEVFVFATGSMSESDRLMEALTMGARDFWLKPYKERAVRISMEHHIA